MLAALDTAEAEALYRAAVDGFKDDPF